MKSRTTRFSVRRRVTRCFSLQSSRSVTITPARHAIEIRDHHRHARNEFWSVLMRCPFPSSASGMLPRVVAISLRLPKRVWPGSFESRPGGGKPWLGFRIVCKASAGFVGGLQTLASLALKVANVALFSTRRERALCDSTGAVSTGLTRAFVNGRLGAAGQPACRFATGPG